MVYLQISCERNADGPNAVRLSIPPYQEAKWMSVFQEEISKGSREVAKDGNIVFNFQCDPEKASRLRYGSARVAFSDAKVGMCDN